MRKLNLRMLTTVSAAAMLVASTAFANDVYMHQSLPADDWNTIFQWNEQYAEGALGAAIIDATQIASIYAVQVDAAVINADDTLYIEQEYWTQDGFSSYDSYTADGSLDLEAGNGLYALTTRNDALIDGITQVANTAFQTASVDVTGEGVDLTTIDLIQTVDGEGYYRDYEGTYSFGLVSDNNIAAIAAFQGTAVIDGQVFDTQTEEMVNGVQQAVVSLNTLGVTADDGNQVVINLNDGQALDTYGVSGGEDYWNGDDYLNDSWNSYEQFTLESTNQAFAYAPHPVIANDPAVKNLDQIAAVTVNSINVGATDGTADFTIGDTYWLSGGSDNYASQEADFNNNYNNLSQDSSYWDVYNGYDVSNYSNEVNVRNTAVATTYLGDVYWDGGQDLGYNIGLGYNGGTLDAWADVGANLGYGYDGVGNVALESLSQVASIGINSINNKGIGDLKLTGNELFWVGEDLVSNDMNFDQAVYDFTFFGGASDANSNYWSSATDYTNFAEATTDVGDVTVDGVDQTTSFAFNSIRSGGDVIGWTELDKGIYSEISQYADTEVYLSSDTLQELTASTNEGDLLAQDLSQTLALSSNTISANGSIRADISQQSDAEWDLNEANDLDLYAAYGDMTGGNIAQTVSLTANSIATRDVLDANGDVVTAGGDLTTAYINQDSYDVDLSDVDYNELDLYAGSDSTIDLGKLSQIAMVSLNSVDVAGDITIDTAFDGDSGLLYQYGTDYGIGNGFGNNAWAHATDGVSLGADADAMSVQAAYLNVNAVSAGGTLSGNVDQDIVNDYYNADNRIDVTTFSGLADVSNFAQVAQVNLNDVSAAVFAGGDIDQHIQNGVDINIENSLNAISDIGTVNVEGIVQQATARVNSISGL